MSEIPSDKAPGGFNLERHVQTIMLSIVTGLLAWNYTTTQGTQVDLAALRAQTEGLRADVNKVQVYMEKAANDRYSRSEALADHRLIIESIDRIEERVLVLERDGR